MGKSQFNSTLCYTNGAIGRISHDSLNDFLTQMVLHLLLLNLEAILHFVTLRMLLDVLILNPFFTSQFLTVLLGSVLYFVTAIIL